MKKTILMLTICIGIMISLSCPAQEVEETRKALSKQYAEVAAEEFGLSDEQKEALYERKIQHFADQKKAKVQYKNGKITQAQLNEPNKTFGEYLTKLTGKDFKELLPFYKKVNKILYGI